MIPLFHDAELIEHRLADVEYVEGGTAYRLKDCSQCQCRMNRDGSASENMILKLVETLLAGEDDW